MENLFKRCFVLFFLSIVFLNTTTAQKILQIEKVNSLKSIRYFVGDEITYKLKSDPDYWYTEIISDVIPQDSIVILQIGYVHLSEIAEVKVTDARKWSVALGNKLTQFGLSWGFWSVIGGTFSSTPIGWAALTVPLVTIGVGSIVKFLFKSKRHKIGKRKRLRLLDLSFPRKLDINRT